MAPAKASRLRASRRPLWTCPKCAAQFLIANSYHSCGRFRLDDLFVRADPPVRALFDRFARMVREAGDSKLVPQKTRAVFMSRMRFINVQVRRSALIVGFILRERPEDARFIRIDAFPPRTYACYVRFTTMSDLDGDVRRWIRQAYESGLDDLRRPRA
jgi:hypothetical protein